MSGVEFLVGAAASGTAGTAGFTAATGGLFGAGGVVTAGASASTLGTLAAVTSGIGSIAQGNAASNAANFNAQVANNNAIAARAAAAENAKRERRLGAKRRGANRSLDPDKLDLLEDSAIEEELNVQSILHQGELQSAGFGNNASLDIAGGKNAKTAGFTSAFGSVLQGGASAAGRLSGGSTGGNLSGSLSGPGTVGGYYVAPDD